MKPLEGLCILSIEQFAAGPYGSMFLADMGADVIKIENKEIGGDPSRFMGPYFLGSGDSLVFQGWNTNKQSVCLDLKTEAGRAEFETLVAQADAVVNNLRGDQPAKLRAGLRAPESRSSPISCACTSPPTAETTRRAAWPGTTS